MTTLATQGCVCSRQWECRLVMVELSSRPTRGCVANRAVGWESGLRVVGICRSLKILHVAAGARRRSTSELPVHVTLLARNIDVRTGEWELGEGVVVEARGLPGRGCVASLACCRKSRLQVVGLRRALEVLHVTSGARCRSSGELAVHVTLLTCHVNVCSRERELGERVVIECRGLPGRGCVARLASGRKSRLHVIRVRRALEILHMASRARSWGTRELAVRVTLLAGHVGVCAGERKFRERVVIEGRRLPCSR
jgi:hypothetical protein